MSRTFRFSALFALGLAFVAAACSDDDPVSPDPITMEDVAGDYVAEGDVGSLVFTVEEDDETTDTDWLEEGAEIVLELTKDGKTSGHLLLPGYGEGGEDFEADLEGTWTLSGDTVKLSHDADTFLKKLPLIVKNDKLQGKGEVSGTVIEVELVKE